MCCARPTRTVDGMRKIADADRKGGVGKITSVAHLAAGLALAGRRALLIDSHGRGGGG